MSLGVALAVVAACRWFPPLAAVALPALPLLAGACACALSTIGHGAFPSGPSAAPGAEVEAEPAPWPLVSTAASCAFIAQFFLGVVSQPYVFSASAITLQFCLFGIAAMAVLTAWQRLSPRSVQQGFVFTMLGVTVVGLTLFGSGVLNSLIPAISLVGVTANCLLPIGWMLAYDAARSRQFGLVAPFALVTLLFDGALGVYSGITVRRATGLGYGEAALLAIVCMAAFALLYVIAVQLYGARLKREAEQAHERAQAASELAQVQVREAAEQARAQVREAAQQAEAAVAQARAAEQAADEAAQKARDVLQSVAEGADAASALRQQAFAERHRLTPRETEILGYALSGMTRAAIAGEIYTSEANVRYHLQNIYAKCLVNSRSELTKLYRSESQ